MMTDDANKLDAQAWQRYDHIAATSNDIRAGVIAALLDLAIDQDDAFFDILDEIDDHALWLCGSPFGRASRAIMELCDMDNNSAAARWVKLFS